MKSLVAVVALASALGVGYWKMQNPEGGIEDAKTQAQSLLDRLGKGVDTVRTGNLNSNGATLPAQAAVNETFSSRLAALEASREADQAGLLDRVAELETQLQKASAAAGGDSGTAPAVDSGAINQRLNTIDDTLATAATLASDTESRMIQLEESIGTIQSGATSDSEVSAIIAEELSDFRSGVTEELASQNAAFSERIDTLEKQVTSAMSAGEQSADALNKIAALETRFAQSQQNAQANTEQQLSASRAAMDSQLDGLRTRVQVLTSERSSLLAGQSASDQQVAELNEKLETLTTRLNTLASVSANSDNSDTDAPSGDALAAVTAQVDQRLAAIEERVAAATTADTRTALDAMQAKLNEATSRMADLEGKLDSALGASVTKLDSSVTAVSGEVSGINTQVSGLQSEVTAVSGEVSSINTQVSGLQSEVTAVSGEVTGINTQVSGLQTELGELKGGYNEMQASLSSLSGNVDSLKSTLESYAIEDLQNDLQAKLDNIETRIQSTPSSDIESLTRTLEQSRDRIKTLEQRVTDLPASSDESESARKAQTALEQQIKALEQRLSNPQAATDPALANTLTAVQKKVNELEQRRYVTAEDLQRSTQTRTIQYKIYFDKSQIAISEDAAKVLDSFITQESNRATSISIFGTTDRTGSSEYNEQLAKRRANRVRSYLIQRGYDFTKIGAVDGIGEDLAAAELPDGQEDPNLRSVIIYAYQP